MSYDIGDRVKDDRRDLTVINKSYFVQCGRKNWYYQYHCNVCGYECEDGYRSGKLVEGRWYDKSALDRYGCPCCSGKIVVPHINSIRVTHPNLSKYFVNDDDVKYVIGSCQRVDMQCPHCGTFKPNVLINILGRYKYSCPVCSDGMSIGERMIYYILENTSTDFEKEFSFPENDWRYDFYIPEYNAIIEVHGEQHYHQTAFGDLNEIQENDKNKMEFALNHGIEKYMIVNAVNSDFNYIKSSIVDSGVANLCDLTIINWDDMKSSMFDDSIVKDICEYWESHKDATYVDMEKVFHYSEHTIRKYLKIGYDLGWCHKDKRNSNTNKKRSSALLYTPKNAYFKTVALCHRMSAEVIGESVPESTIRYKLSRDNYPDFQYITQEEFDKAFYDGKLCYGDPFNKIA